MRSNYWSCTKFANLLRGSKKPHAASSEDWDEWSDKAKARHPVRYWLAEELLDKIQNLVSWPNDKLSNISYYVNNRWITKSHSLTAHRSHIKPGEWCDVSERILPCLFDTLVDFVEIESAWIHCAFNKEARKKYQVPWWRTSVIYFRAWRSPEAGIEHLKWAAGLTDEDYRTDDQEPQPTPQALAAKEILELYTWWKEVYPNRPDPMDASGWNEYCQQSCELNGGKFFGSKTTPELDKLRNRSHKLLAKIEKQYQTEDDKMLARLIKVRRSLWT